MNNPFDHGSYDEHDLRAMGFKAVGEGVRIAKTCTIFGLGNIEIGSNVRLDGYTTISAGASGAYVRIGSHVHIGGYGLLIAGEGIDIEDFANISQGVRLYTRSDDYSGESMTNPMIPAAFTNVTGGAIRISRHAILGSGSTILPGVRVGEGVALGSMSLVKNDLAPWGIYAGIPARRIKERSRKLLELEARYLQAWGTDV